MQNRHQSKVKGISQFFLAIGILILSLFAMTGISMVVVQKFYGLSITDLTSVALEDASLHQTMAIKIAQLITALSFVVAGFVCVKTYRQKFVSFMGLSTSFNVVHVLLGILMLFALFPAVDALVRFNAALQLPESIASSFSDLEAKSNHTYDLFLKFNQGGQFVLNLLIMSLVAAIGEEFFFRGILMRVLTKWFGSVHMGIILSSVIFTIIHFQPYKFLPMMVLGLFLGYMYYRTRSLWVPMIIHALNNAIVVIADWSEKSGNTLPIFQEDFQFSTFQIIISTIAFAGIGYLFWKKTHDSDFNYE